MQIQTLINQLNADREFIERENQYLGMTPAEAERRVTSIDHTKEVLSKCIELGVTDTDELHRLSATP